MAPGKVASGFNITLVVCIFIIARNSLSQINNLDTLNTHNLTLTLPTIIQTHFAFQNPYIRYRQCLQMGNQP